MRIRMRAARSSASWCAECASTEKSCCRTILKMSLMLESNKLAKKIRRLFRISLYGTLNALSTRARALVRMGGRCVGHGGWARTPRFFEANVKSLILTIGAPPPDLY